MSVLCAIVSCEVKGTLELNLATVTCNGREVVKCSLYTIHIEIDVQSSGGVTDKVVAKISGNLCQNT